MDDSTIYRLAGDAIDESFGIGVKEAHDIIQTNAGAKVIYDCAIKALAGEISEKMKIRENLARIAEYLKHLPTCHACEVEGQQSNCNCIHARWAGREIWRTLDRPGWVTKALAAERD